MKHDTLYRLGAAIVTLSVLLGLVGCTAEPEPQGLVVHASEKPRQVAQAAENPDIAALVAGNNAFACDLYQALHADAGNLLVSPYSISLALAMTYAGARGVTEQQMAETLHFLPQETLHPAFNALDQELNRQGEGEADFRLHVVNALWGQHGYEFLDTYLDTIAEHYGAGLRTLDFVREPEQARQTINDWASEETEERIQDLLPPGSIDPMTTLVLSNAIYFKAAWAEPFMEDGTAEEDFTLLDGTTVPVQMMRGLIDIRYVQEKGYQAIELPYSGGEMSMLILLPDEGGFETFAGALDSETIAYIVSGLQYAHFSVRLPKFGYESSLELAQVLSEMGMPAAFSGADFSGMDGTKELFIDQIYHKTFVDVNEQGTEAAGATAVVMKRLAMPQEVRIDRPFIYAIRDNATNSILFVGQVVDPR
jgi:serpin B